ncbi:hypothetical protein HDU96_010076 [Phlyctochytrium bullatum]|nr:hypothetical protein HDU96_010076 [Phlyctochytrium bullatum]
MHHHSAINNSLLAGSTIPQDAFATGWPKLQSLSLSGSSVSGATLPLSLNRLIRLNLDGNPGLEGRLPDDPAAVWPFIQELGTSGTQISATVNDNWSKLTELTRLRIGNRQTERRYVNGTLEPLTRLSKLVEIDVSGGEFNSTLPENLVTNNPNLTSIVLAFNNLYGTIPASYANYLRSPIGTCDLQGNFLNGPIPPAIYASGCTVAFNCFEMNEVADKLWTNISLTPNPNNFQRGGPGAGCPILSSISSSPSIIRTIPFVASTTAISTLPTLTSTRAPTGTTAASDSQNGNTTLPTSVLIGIGVGGGVLLIAVMVLSCILCCRRRPKRSKFKPSDNAYGGMYGTYYPPPPTDLYQSTPVYQPPSAPVPQYAPPAIPVSAYSPFQPNSVKTPVEPAPAVGAYSPREPIPPSSMSGFNAGPITPRQEPVPPPSIREPVPPPSWGASTPQTSTRTVPDLVSSFDMRGGGGTGAVGPAVHGGSTRTVPDVVNSFEPRWR